MTDSAPAVDAATASDNTLSPIDYQPPADTQEALSIDDALRLMSEPVKPEKPQAESAEAETPATAETESAQADADQPEADPGETTEATETEETPAIDPPRSWTKEAKERWDSLPRDTQEYLAQREQERDREVRRSQNDAADQRKAMEAERKAVEQLKQQYEARLPDLAKTLEQALQSEFGDIKDLNDVRQLQLNDPFRFQQWQLRQMELAAAQKEQADIQSRREQESASKWANYTQTEDEKFSEALSEKDRSNLKELMNSAPTFLEDKGFSKQELADLWNKNETFRDHRIQLLILDAMKYRDLQKAPLKAIPKPVPPVQRPGTVAPKGAARSQSIQALNQRLTETGNQDDAFALWMAQRQAS